MMLNQLPARYWKRGERGWSSVSRRDPDAKESERYWMERGLPETEEPLTPEELADEAART